MPPTLAPWTADLHVEVAVSAEVEQDAVADALLPALQRLAVIRAIVLLPGSQRHRVMAGDVRRQAGSNTSGVPSQCARGIQACAHHAERHVSEHIGWLRAAVLPLTLVGLAPMAGMIAAVSGGSLASLALLGMIAARAGGASATRGRLAGTTA